MLSDDEKALVSRLIQEKSDYKRLMFDYAVYILPTAAFAAYGIIKEDFFAVLVAYGALLFMVIIYIGYTHQLSKTLRSALLKYEEKIKEYTANE